MIQPSKILKLETEIASATSVDQPWRTTLFEALATGVQVQIPVSKPHDLFAAAMPFEGRLLVQGNLGDYAFSNLQQLDVTILGNVGYAAGQSMHSGVLQVNGDVGDFFATNASGGIAVVNGNVANDLAAGIRDGAVLISGNVGHRAGRAMRGGVIVIAGDCGEQLGYRAAIGTIYVSGKVSSLFSAMVERRMREPDRLRLSLVLAQCKTAASVKDFRVFKAEPR